MTFQKSGNHQGKNCETATIARFIVMLQLMRQSKLNALGSIGTRHFMSDRMLVLLVCKPMNHWSFSDFGSAIMGHQRKAVEASH